MKKFLTVLALGGLSLASCKKDDETSTNKLVGDWKVDKTEYYENNVLVDTDNTPATMNFSSCGFNSFCDGKYNVAAFGLEMALKYKVNSEHTQLVMELDGQTQTCVLSLTNNNTMNFSLSYEEDGVNFKDITFLTKN